jgi:hypothetical protein
MAERRQAPQRESGSEREMRDQEVRRANRELRAYFKGLRTEREARAALKVIKAFVRAREREDPRHRSPLPGLAKTSAKSAKARPTGRPRRRSGRTIAPAETQPAATDEGSKE